MHINVSQAFGDFGTGSLSARTTSHKLSAAIVTRLQTSVSGGSSSTATPTKKNDPPHSKESVNRTSHSRAVIDWFMGSDIPGSRCLDNWRACYRPHLRATRILPGSCRATCGRAFAWSPEVNVIGETDREMPAVVAISIGIPMMAPVGLVGLVGVVTRAPGEETGWRGFLVGKCAKSCRSGRSVCCPALSGGSGAGLQSFCQITTPARMAWFCIGCS